MRSTPSPEPSPAHKTKELFAGSAAFVIRVGLLVLTGPFMALWWGWAPALFVLVLAWIAMEVRLRVDATHLASEQIPLSAWPQKLHPFLQWSYVGLWILPAIILVTIASRSIGALFVRFPAILWPVAGVLVAILLLVFVSRRMGWMMGVALTVVLLFGGSWFGGYQQKRAIGTQGYAHSGPILGIHPFQSLAVVIDGYGPFDIPIADFVTPDGSLGLDPQALAKVLEESLEQIAEVHFAKGPARAYQGFAHAHVEAVEVPAIREHLDRPPDQATDARLIVYSGSTGPHSRVEFVCPGLANDPRGLQEDTVMEPLCPKTGTPEANAGLGMTGRWAGYVEVRGSGQLRLAKALGWKPQANLRVQEAREERVWAWLLLCSVFLGVWHRHSRVINNLYACASAVVLASAAILLLVLFWQGPELAWHPIPAWMKAAPWRQPWSIFPWLCAFALCSGFGMRIARGQSPRRTLWALRGGCVLVLLVTGMVAAHPSAQSWLRPELWNHHQERAMEGLVVELADRFQAVVSLDLVVVETCIASALVILMLGLLAALMQTVPTICTRPFPHSSQKKMKSVCLSLLVLAPAMLVYSRQTQGGALLLELALVMSCLAGAISFVPQLMHRWRWILWFSGCLFGLAIVLWTIRETFVRQPQPGLMFVALMLLAAILSLSSVLWFWRRVNAGEG